MQLLLPLLTWVLNIILTEKGFAIRFNAGFQKQDHGDEHKTDYILRHEQGHFDIAEIFARKLNKKMSEYKFNKTTYQKDLKISMTDY